MFTVVPDADEAIQWKDLAYYNSSRGVSVSARICQIRAGDAPAVRQVFIHGAFLSDPNRLLEAKRYIRLLSYANTPGNVLKELIQSSARFDPNTQSFQN